MDTLAQQYMGNNAHLIKISKLMNAQEKDSHFPWPKTSNKNTLNKSNQEQINGILELFVELFSMFDDIPFNDSIMEGTWTHVKVDKGLTSDSFLFERQSLTGMLWKIQDSFCLPKFLSVHKTMQNWVWEP